MSRRAHKFMRLAIHRRDGRRVSTCVAQLAMAKGDLSYDEARRWLAAYPVEGATKGQLRRQALRLSAGSLPAMIDVLAHGSDAEVNGAFNVLYHHGARIDREGDSPQSCRYRVTFRDGSVRTVRPDNLVSADFEDDRMPPDDGPAVEGPKDLAKSWISETILALITAVMSVPHIRPGRRRPGNDDSQ
jgi:hypothetical protein